MNGKNNDHGVFLIYTGGTVGSVPRDKNDPLSPLKPANNLDQIISYLPNYDARDKKLLLRDQWIRIGTYSWPEPIDSSNIQLKDWQDMAAVIKQNYDEYEGFVILHGTDTLAYTASALAFMLDNLSKPVIITGSQLPIGKTRSDAVQNIVTSSEIAAAKSLGADVIPEVMVFFRDELYRGCRTTKLSASSFNAFDSPNFPPLARAGEHVVVNKSVVSKPRVGILRVVDELEPNIASIDIFPGMNIHLLKNLLKTPGLRGVALQTFGTGNAPTTTDFLETIEEAVLSGKLIVNITQCRQGEVELGLYDVSAGLLSREVISGMDMTIEAALTKMFVTLGRERESDVRIAADKMQLNLKGEQRQSIFNLHFGPGQVGEDDKPCTVDPIRPMVGADVFEMTKLDRAILRVMGLRTLDNKRGRIEFDVFIDLPNADAETKREHNRHWLGSGNKTFDPKEGPENVFLTVTDTLTDFLDNRHTNTLTFVNRLGPFTWEKINMACFVNT